jgi:hypothetical protein
VVGRGDYRGVRGQGGPPPIAQGRGAGRGGRGVRRGQGLEGVRGEGHFRGGRGGGRGESPRGQRDQPSRPVATVQPLTVQPLAGSNQQVNWDEHRYGGNRARGNNFGQRYR